MEQNLKTTLKSAFIAGMVILATLSAQAYQPLGGAYVQGNLLAGFTTGSGTDLIVNLGPQSSLAYGNQWNLSSLLTGNLATYANIQFGVIGASTGPNKIYATMTGTTLPNHFGTSNPNSSTAFNTINTPITGVGNLLNGTTGYGTPAWTATGEYSWYGQTYGGSGNTFMAKAGYSPDGQVGEATLDFYAVSQGSAGAITLIGTFTLDANGILTYSQVVAATPPTVTLNTPTNNASYAGFATIPLSATVVSNNNTIASVQFYNGATLLATVTTPPYTANWTYVSTGSYPTVTAQAIYGSSSVTSAVASVTVNALVKPAAGVSLKNTNGYSFSFTGPVGQPYTILSSTNVTLPIASWTVALTNVFFDATGSASYTNSTPTGSQLFYRIQSP